jgi:phosphoribosylanthranilate isomerase
MKVLARRITNLTDARYFAAKDVAYLAFNMEAGTEGYLDPMYMQAMREWVEGPIITGEFNEGTSIEVINEAVRFYNLGAVIVPATLRHAQIEAPEIIVKVMLQQEQTNIIGISNTENITAFLLELNDVSLSWLDMQDFIAHISIPIIIQFDADIAVLPDILRYILPYGISLKGGEEEAVGIKSFDEVEDIFDLLEVG